MDLSDLFRKHVERQNLGNRVVDPIELTNNRRESQLTQRKNKRDDLLAAMRNIKADMSPCISPLVTDRTVQRASKRNVGPKWGTSTPNVCQSQRNSSQSSSSSTTAPSEAVLRRLQRLALWKAEKEKNKQAAKAKEKPIFKVCHVSDSVPVMDNNAQDNITALIKGKSILAGAIKRRQFAPENSKFNPPAGVKPIPQFEYKRHLGKNTLNASSTLGLSDNNNKHKSTTGPSTSRSTMKSQVEKKTPLPISLPKTANSKPVSSASSRSKLGPTSSRTVVPKHKPHDSSSTKTPLTRNPAESRLGVSQKVAQRNPIATRNNNKAKMLTSSSSSSISISSTSSDTRPIHSNTKIKPEDKSKLKNNNNQKEIPLAKIKAVVPDKKNNQKMQDSTNTSNNKRKAKSEKKPTEVSRTDSVAPQLNRLAGDKRKLNIVKKEIKSKKAETLETADGVAPPLNQLISDKNKLNIKKEIKSKKAETLETADVVAPPLNWLVSDKHKLDIKKEIKSRKAETLETAVQIKTPKLNGLTSEKEKNLSTKKLDTIMKTPNLKNEIIDAPVYVSPFVTISRGKKEAIKEFKIRRSMGPDAETPNNSAKRKSTKEASPKDSKFFNPHTSPKAGADYFMTQLTNEIDRINVMCAKWQVCLEDPELPEEATSSINVVVGHSQLLISKKFNQFRQLIIQCKTQQYEEKEITCEDLHGFWDMVYMQVEDLDKRFANLDRMKQNNWEEILPQKKAPVKRTKTARGPAKKVAATSKLRDLIKAARAKKMAADKGENIQGEKRLEEAHVEAITPLKEQQVNLIPTTTSTKRKSLRVSILVNECEKKRLSSPGLTMMKLSQSIKQNNGLTPYKSILKIDGCKSTGKKSVVFKDFSSPTNMLKKTRLFDESDDLSKSPCENILEVPIERKSVRRSLGFKEDDEKENTPTCRRSARVRARRSLSVC